MENFTIIGQNSVSCTDLLKNCTESCYSNRIAFTNSLDSRFTIALTVFIILTYVRILVLHHIKYDNIIRYQRIIDILLIIIGLFLLCVIYIF